jgi:hypothetical protein
MMTGLTELFFGLGIIGTLTAIIVGAALILGRKEWRVPKSNSEVWIQETLRRAG